MIGRQIIKNTLNISTILKYSFSNPFFTKFTPSKDGDKIDSNFVNDGEEKLVKQVSNNSNLQALINKINEANKYFLGIKLNTNYLKVNKIVNYDDVCKLTTDKTTVNDIPIEISKRQADKELFQKVNQQEVLNQKSAQIVFSKSRIQPTKTQIKKIIQNYVNSIAQKKRISNVEPNFQIQCIKALNSLDSKLQIDLSNQDAEPEIKIKSVTLLKGLSAYRNDNYSTDSFEKDQHEIADGIISYKLYRQLKQEYPEIEWFSTKKITARFQILVRGGPILTVLQSGNKIGSTENIVHSVVIETDLVPPPPHAEDILNAQQYLRSYRLDYKQLILTNFDRKNQFYAFTYTEQQKKSKLVNRII